MIARGIWDFCNFLCSIKYEQLIARGVVRLIYLGSNISFFFQRMTGQGLRVKTINTCKTVEYSEMLSSVMLTLNVQQYFNFQTSFLNDP